MSDDLYNGSNGTIYLRRWSLTDRGQFECIEDAVNVARISSTDMAAIEARNAALHAARSAVLDYEAALLVAEPDDSVPKTQDVLDDEGNVTGREPTPAWAAYDAAQATITAATDPVKALARVRAGLGPDADEAAQEAYVADQATIAAEWGGTVEITILPDPVPESVSSRQFKLQLHIAGLTDTVEGWINSQDPTVRIAYENSGSFVRSEPMMASGFAALGFSEAQIDAFFVAAGKL